MIAVELVREELSNYVDLYAYAANIDAHGVPEAFRPLAGDRARDGVARSTWFLARTTCYPAVCGPTPIWWLTGMDSAGV